MKLRSPANCADSYALALAGTTATILLVDIPFLLEEEGFIGKAHQPDHLLIQITLPTRSPFEPGLFDLGAPAGVRDTSTARISVVKSQSAGSQFCAPPVTSSEGVSEIFLIFISP